MNTVPKRICDELKVVLENAVENNHRSFIIIAGNHCTYQVPVIHTILSKIRGQPVNSILWCYTKELALSSNQKKMTKQIKEAKDKGQVIDETANQISVFLNSHKILYKKYKDTSSILGQTFDMLILQNFEDITPNNFARTIETVSGKGTILLLLESMNNITDLYSQVTGSKGSKSHNLAKRFVATIKQCGNCICIDSEFNALSGVIKTPILTKTNTAEIELQQMIKELSTTPVIGPLIEQTKTKDQARVLLHLFDILQSGDLGKIVGITAARGRGKSAVLGLALAAAIAQNFSNIFVTSPSPENLKTLWEFVIIGLTALGLQRDKDFDVETSVESKDVTLRVNVHQEMHGHTARQTISYIRPSDSRYLSNCELLAIDEAAAIPLPIVRRLIGQYNVFLSSTVNGYEGTGRALSLKLFEELANKKKDGSTMFTKVEMESPIRYSENDPIEAWLNSYLCLDVQPSEIKSLPDPNQCTLYMVNRDLLFSGKKLTEECLRSIVSLSVASHYKNEPNDLILMADSPKHRIFCLVPPVQKKSEFEVICYIQVAVEGNFSKEKVSDTFNRGSSPTGDLIPWKVAQHLNSPEFAQLTGIRIVRIAVHPQMQGKGYGKRAIEQLLEYYSSPCPEPNENPNLIFKSLTNADHEFIHYASVSFGLTERLFKFWAKNGFSPVYIAQNRTQVTGEHSIFVLRDLHPSEEAETEEVSWLDSFKQEFRKRFSHLLAYDFQSFSPTLVNMIYDNVEPTKRADVDPSAFLDENDIRRLQKFVHGNGEYSDIKDLMPNLAELYFQRLIDVDIKSRLKKSILSSIGFQHCSLEECAANHGIQINQVIGNLKEIVGAMVKYCDGKVQKTLSIRIKSVTPE